MNLSQNSLEILLTVLAERVAEIQEFASYTTNQAVIADHARQANEVQALYNEILDEWAKGAME